MLKFILHVVDYSYILSKTHYKFNNIYSEYSRENREKAKVCDSMNKIFNITSNKINICAVLRNTRCIEMKRYEIDTVGINEDFIRSVLHRPEHNDSID